MLLRSVQGSRFKSCEAAFKRFNAPKARSRFKANRKCRDAACRVTGGEMLIPLRDTSRPYIFYAIVHLIPLKKHHRNTIVIMIPLQVEEFIVPLQSKPR
jgi:hypothetical protein